MSVDCPQSEVWLTIEVCTVLYVMTLGKQMKSSQTDTHKHSYALIVACWMYSTRVLEDTPVDTVACKHNCFHVYTNTPKKETNADTH